MNILASPAAMLLVGVGLAQQPPPKTQPPVAPPPEIQLPGPQKPERSPQQIPASSPLRKDKTGMRWVLPFPAALEHAKRTKRLLMLQRIGYMGRQNPDLAPRK